MHLPTFRFRQQLEFLHGFKNEFNLKANPLDESDLEHKEKDKHLYCKACNNKITNENQKIAMGGKIENTFFNPHGNLFQVCCFKEAQGCHIVGVSSSEFSWFPGYSWQIVNCLCCQNHLGWLFSKGLKTYFFGLIITRLKQK
ncbi:MAG: hypothetical protein HQL71_05595 [Magnetococcales bacterium]|nr:hypothetical protein [Magnetococcales bacterium]